MGRRVLVAVIAIAVAAAGTFFIWQWATNLEDGFRSEFESVEVYVATAAIAENSDVVDLTPLVSLQPIVRESVVPGAITDLAQIPEGYVTDIDILPGEQLVQARFVDPQTKFEELFERVDAPEGLLEVTFSVTEERMVGGQIRPGDLVAFIASFPPLTVDPNYVEPGSEDALEDAIGGAPEDNPDTEVDESLVQTPNVTSTVVHKVLVTNLQYAEPPALTDEEGEPVQEDPRQAPQSQLYVTVAAEIGDIEKMVFVREFGTIWLALETEDDPETSSQVVTRATIFAD